MVPRCPESWKHNNNVTGNSRNLFMGLGLN